jgi:hypothetical protein
LSGTEEDVTVLESELGAQEELWRRSDSDVEDRLLWTTGTGKSSWESRSGVPSRLGRAGGVAWADVPTSFARGDETGWAGDMTEVITGWAGSRGGLVGDSSSSRLARRNFWDDFRGGGFGAGGGSRVFFFFWLFSPSFTVDVDDDDVKHSRTAARPCGSALIESTSFGILPALLRVTGGLVCAGLAGVTLGTVGIRSGATKPGDCDEMEVVGVVSRL